MVRNLGQLRRVAPRPDSAAVTRPSSASAVDSPRRSLGTSKDVLDATSDLPGGAAHTGRGSFMAWMFRNFDDPGTPGRDSTKANIADIRTINVGGRRLDVPRRASATVATYTQRLEIPR